MASEYLQREEAAKKQLGKKGVKKRVKQLPTAARAFTREMTGIDISRKGVKVDPFGVAMALPLGKVLKAANVLRAAGQAGKAATLSNRLVAKSLGKDAGRLIAQNRGATNSFIRENVIGNAKKVRNLSAESVFPRKTFDSGSRGLRDEYLVAKSGYEKVFGKGKKLSSFNPDIAAMTSIPGRGATTAKIRKISDQVDAYLAKRGRKGLGR